MQCCLLSKQVSCHALLLGFWYIAEDAAVAPHRRRLRAIANPIRGLALLVRGARCASLHLPVQAARIRWLIIKVRAASFSDIAALANPAGLQMMSLLETALASSDTGAVLLCA